MASNEWICLPGLVIVLGEHPLVQNRRAFLQSWSFPIHQAQRADSLSKAKAAIDLMEEEAAMRIDGALTQFSGSMLEGRLYSSIWKRDGVAMN